jgi:hypothetical protein
MRVTFKLMSSLADYVRFDLARPHPVAAERVGFFSCRVAGLSDGGLLILAQGYHQVDDADYLDDPRVGAMINADAIRKALQYAYTNPVGMFHVHCHEHRGVPWFSGTDLSESSSYVPDFWNVRPRFPHGTILLSRDAMSGLCWLPDTRRPVRIDDLVAVGAPMTMVRGRNT